MKLSTGREYDLSYFAKSPAHAEQLRTMGECQVWMNLYDTSLSNARKYNPDPYKFMQLHFDGMPWRCYVVGPSSTYEFDYTCGPEEVKGVYPSWHFRDFNLRELQNYIEEPWSEYAPDPDMENSWRLTPKPDQPHKVFIYQMARGKNAVRLRSDRVNQIQELYPEVQLVPCVDIANYQLQFGGAFTASCIDFRYVIRCGELIDPYGRRVKPVRLKANDMAYNDRLTGRGWTRGEDWDNEQMVRHMIATSRYAAHHWQSELGLAPTRRWDPVDYSSPTAIAGMPSYSIHNAGPAMHVEDKILCTRCSLAPRCNSYREGSVCNLPKEPTGKLARLAQSRDPRKIIELMSTVVAHQAERVEDSMEDEHKDGDGVNANIDKQLNNLFRNSVTLAKLLDPSLGRPAPLVQINTGNGASAVKLVAGADERSLSTYIIEALEARGVKREDITEEMVEFELEQLQLKAGSIEGEVVP